MALETLAENYARLLGYFTETRVPALNKENSYGDKKNDNSLGDIDVIGLSASGKLLAVDTKGYGSVENYENWCKGGSLVHIYNLIDKLKNTKDIKSKRWSKKFKKRGFDEIWVVISGPFKSKQEMALFDLRKNFRGQELINSCIVMFNKMYLEYNESEKDYLIYFENKLSRHFGIKCKVIPIHKLIESLIIKVVDDMSYRRKRYSDTAMETFRWIVRATGHNCLDLGEIGKKIKKKYKENL